MLSEWHKVKLGEVAEELTVGFVGTMAAEYVERGIPFLRSLNVCPLEVNKNDLKFISPEFHQKLSKSRLNPGDVVIVRTGKPGSCAIIPDWLPEANCSDLVIVRCGERINNRFLAYYINTETSKHIAAHLVGAVQQHFNVGSARDLLINLPPLVEQKAIAKALGALDDKIELNRRMNATLEAMARALFKSWFVDFDPVRTKMAGAQPFGMDAETAALFPSRLVSSELGDIPEGWTVDQIGNVVAVVGGGTPSTENLEYWTGGQHAWATPKDLSALKSPVLLSTERQITDAGIRVISSGLLPSGTVLMSSRAPIGYIAITETPVAINQGFIAIICNKQLPNLYVWQWLQINLDMIKSHANGSTFQEISKGSFRPLACLVPEVKVLEKFQEIVLPIWHRLVANEKERLGLEKTRDYLLPKLISGDVRIPDAEKMVGGV